MTPVECRWCGAELADGTRPRRYCSTAHQQAAYDALHAGQRRSPDEGPDVPLNWPDEMRSLRRRAERVLAAAADGLCGQEMEERFGPNAVLNARRLLRRRAGVSE